MFPSFLAYAHPKIFRNSVKYKRYYIGLTRFTRRHLRKLRHKATWPLYYNVLKYWTDALRFAKQYARFQYNYRLFINNTFASHGNIFASRRNHLYVSQKHCVGSTLTRCFFLTLRNHLNDKISKSHWGGHHTAVFFPQSTLIGDADTKPLLAFFDNQCFAKNSELNFDIFTEFIDLSIINLLLNMKHVELYKFLILVWYIKILNLNTYVWLL